MTTNKQLEKRIDELEEKIDKLTRLVVKQNWYKPYEKPKRKKCPCCGNVEKNPYPNIHYDRVIY
mgnify:CR=1 FL=1|tara:strand:- start:1072 stop:1263 length:192 start_codon:yes stop_codon:yes gene_type:complete